MTGPPKKRRVPRKYLRPRSMLTPSRQQHPFWDIVPLEFVACLLMVSVVFVAPLRAADAWVHAELLTLVGKRTPPESVLVVTVPERLVAHCESALANALRKGQARGVVLIPPVAGLCGTPSRLLPGRPVLTLSADTIRRPAGAEVVGFRPRAVDWQAFAALGLANGSWVAPRHYRGVPTSSLGDFAAGRMPYDVLRSRVVVVALRDPFRDDELLDDSLPVRIAGAVAGALEDRPRRAASPLLLAVAAGAAGVLLALSSRRRRPPLWASRLTHYGLTVLFLGASLAGLLGYGVLIPIPSTLAALVSFFGVVHLPGFIARRRADVNTSELLAQARLVGAREAYELPDEEFWNRLAKRVEHGHPSEGVLLAELPPFAWRLRVHPNGDLSETIIRERRRDVRRFPFSDDNGKREIRIHRGFLVMAGVPTVLVPLEVQGEPEGYIFLIGKAAEAAFLARPELTHQLGEGIAKLVRHRRLEKLKADDWRRPGGVLVNRPSDRSAGMISGARAALERLELFKKMVVSAPVGLLYADSFGDVRLMSQSTAQWLGRFGLQVPPLSDNGSLESAALSLMEVLDVLTNEVGLPAPSIEEISETGVSFEVPLPGVSPEELSKRALLFVVKRFTKNETPGFVASLVEVERSLAALPTNVERLPERGDPLTVFSLAEALQQVTTAIAPRTQGSVRLQTPRVMGNVVAHRQELLGAIESFLVGVVEGSGAPGPTLALRERSNRVELTILDLRLGAPPGALRRTLVAPSEPPPGLGPLGQLTRAVQNSHGIITARHEDGWGVQLTLSLVRAHPRVVARPAVDAALRLAPKRTAWSPS